MSSIIKMKKSIKISISKFQLLQSTSFDNLNIVIDSVTHRLEN